MIVADIMSANPVTINMDTALWLIKEIFDHVYFHHLLVEGESDKIFVGVISDRGLFKVLNSASSAVDFSNG